MNHQRLSNGRDPGDLLDHAEPVYKMYHVDCAQNESNFKCSLTFETIRGVFVENSARKLVLLFE